MRLIHEKSGEPIVVGQTCITSSGERVVVQSIEKPHKPSSTGRVYVTPAGFSSALPQAFFPGVIGAKWIEREDQA